jgi:pimeloyl-ACP methyl ester carboxylesterase
MTRAQKLTIFLIKLKLKTTSAISASWGAKIAFTIFSTPFRKPRPVPPPIFEESDEFIINVNGLKIAGYRWNHQSPQKVLIAHGFESRAYNFYRYIKPLIENGYAVYAMDAKAHGKSEGKTIILPEYVAMMSCLENTYGRFDGLIAHSFGGIATCLFQESFRNSNARLALIAPATETSSAVSRFTEYFSLGDKTKNAIFDLIKERSGNDVSYYSIKRIAPLLSNPILWVHDKNDDITPLKDVQPLIELNLPNIQFLITEGLGHRQIYKENEVVKRVVDFIAKDRK